MGQSPHNESKLDDGQNRGFGAIVFNKAACRRDSAIPKRNSVQTDSFRERY
jgi:hypothetical protein